MASLMEVLIDTLQKECEVYEDLLPVSNEKTKAIISNDLAKLQEITEQEQKVINVINSLEKKRQEAVKDICEVLGLTGKVTIADIVRMMDRQPNEQEKLNNLHKRLKNVVSQLEDINTHNKVLAEQSLEMIQLNLNILQSTMMAPQNANYSRNAYIDNSNIVPHRMMFDTKQ